MIRVKLFLFFFIFILLAENNYGQNLVPNPSFEEYTKCPKETSDCKVVKDWYQPTSATTDYFNECAPKFKGRKGVPDWSVNVPDNFAGFQYARTGRGYIGMYFADMNIDKKSEDYREYFSTKLTAPLIIGKRYKVTLWVCLSKMSELATSNIEILFTKDSLKKRTFDRVKCTPQLSYFVNKPIADDSNWTEVSWVYTSEGEEKFMTIGNFTKAKKCKMGDVKSQNKTRELCAYYYVDDVSVFEIKGDSAFGIQEKLHTDTVSVVKIEKGISPPKYFVVEANKSITLNNVFFESDKSDLLPASFNELDTLVSYLRHSVGNIEISGYTDNTGIPERNLKLSEARAKAVADYLISNGIVEARVTYIGYGTANPIADNDTDEGRARNRRVEFKIKDK